MKTIETIEGARICKKYVRLYGKNGSDHYIIKINIHNGNSETKGPINQNELKNKPLGKIYARSIGNLDKLINTYETSEKIKTLVKTLSEDGIILNEVEAHGYWEEKLYVLNDNKIYIYNENTGERMNNPLTDVLSHQGYKSVLAQVNNFEQSPK